MKKNLLTWIASIAIVLVCVCLLPTEAHAASESDLTFALNSDHTYSVSGCDTAASGELVIPAAYNGKPVSRISNYAFNNCKNLTSVVISDYVINIDEGAFAGCTSLDSVTIPDRLYSIGEGAFAGCTSLDSITIPNSVKRIGEGAFAGCSSLESMTIPFVGNKQKTALDTYQYPFGYIFGTSRYSTNDVAVNQVYYESSTKEPSVSTYYIPYKLKSVTVTGGDILRGAFQNCTMLTSVTLDDSVISIGYQAFRGCTGLTCMIIGNGVTSISEEAFYGCERMTSITIGNGVAAIGLEAFSDCVSLTSVNITDIAAWCKISFPVNVSNPLCYARNLYLNGVLITDLVIPDGVTSLNKYAFLNCTSLNSITIPNSVTSIAEGAFEGCGNVVSMTIPFVGGSRKTASDTYQYPFGYIFGTSRSSLGYCLPVEQWYYGDSTTSRTHSTYHIPSSLSYVTVTGGDILYGAFYGCYTLRSVTIDNRVTSISKYAFYGCEWLKSVTIGNGVTSIGESAFYNCTNLTSVIYCGTQKQWNAIYIKEDNKPLTDATLQFHNIENGVCTICGYKVPYTVTFKNWDNTVISTQSYHWGDEITIPANPTKVADNTYTYTFTGWDSNVVANCAGNATYTATYNSVPIEYTVVFKNWNGDVISEKTYHWNDEITIPENPTKVADNTYTYTFAGWNNPVVACAGNATYTATYTATCLYTYSIADKKITITGYTGNGDNLIIPDTIEGFPVTAIGESAFRDRTSLTSITIPNSVTIIGDKAFASCQYLTSFTIPNSVTRIGDYAFSDCIRLTSITIPSSVTIIGNYAFRGCTGLTNLTISNGVTRIRSNAFEYCRSLTSVTIPESIVEINSYAFASCTGLTTVNFNAINCTTMGWAYPAFSGCSNLTTINIGKTVTNIPSCGFADCTGLTSITIPDSITSIRNSAFAGCTSLTSITIPNSVTSIELSAFNNCIRLTTVNFDGTERQWNQVSIGNNNTDLTNANLNFTKFDVVFKDWDGTVLSAEIYSLGDTIVVPTNPTKAADNTYTYTFAGWNSAVINCAGDATYIATYTETYIEYRITFYDENNALMATHWYHYGDKVTPPVRESVVGDYAIVTYLWMEEVVDCIGNAEYHTLVRFEIIEYTVVFKDWNGDVISEETYHWDDEITIPANPTKVADNANTYTFAGWDTNVAENCAGNATYIATYTATPIEYTVVFKNWNGRVIFSSTYYYGGTVYVPVDPTRPADNAYTYIFAGWDKEVVNCEGNATYTATYTLTPESPVKSIKIQDVVLYEGIDSYDWGYDYSVVLSEVLLKDGSTAKINGNSILYDGNWYYVSDNAYSMQSEEPWTPGNTYTVTGELLGVTATYNVTILEDPIKELQLIKAPDNITTSQDGSPNLKGAVVQIKYKDGTYENIAINDDFTGGYSKYFFSEKLNKSTYIYVNYFFEFTGEQTTELGMFRHFCEIPVIVEENKMESISIREDADKFIIITVYNSDNTSYEMKILELGSLNPDVPGTSFDTAIFTDKGRFSAIIHADENSFSLEIGDVWGNRDGKTVKSNTISSSEWFEVMKYMNKHPLLSISQTQNYIPYDGVITADNIDNIIELAYHLGGLWDTSGTLRGQTVRDVVMKYFAVDNVDLTLSNNYDPVTDTYNYEGMFDLGYGEIEKQRPDRVRYNNGVWTIITTPAINVHGLPELRKNNTIYLKLNDELQIISYNINIPFDTEFTIVFKDWNGTVLFTNTYRWGDTVIVPADPTRVADNAYTYTFAGWGTDVVENCIGNATYIATYTSTPIEYTVVFKNWNGDVLSTKTYHYGDAVTAPTNPTRPADDTYTYTFTGWDKTVVSCNGDAVYMAVYSSKSHVPSTITSSTHTVSGGMISNISTDTTVSALVGKINEGQYVKVYNGNKEVTGNTLIGTGMVVKVMDGNTVKASATVVVTGDTNGDGKITITDMLAAKSHVLKKSTLSGAAGQAADTSGDNAITITDFIQMKAHILGKSKVEPRSATITAVQPVSAPAMQSAPQITEVTYVATNYAVTYAQIPNKKDLVTL